MTYTDIGKEYSVIVEDEADVEYYVHAFDRVVVERDVKLTVEEMVEQMDSALECDNYHDLVGVHAALVKLLRHQCVSEYLVERIIAAIFASGRDIRYFERWGS